MSAAPPRNGTAIAAATQTAANGAMIHLLFRILLSHGKRYVSRRKKKPVATPVSADQAPPAASSPAFRLLESMLQFSLPPASAGAVTAAVPAEPARTAAVPASAVAVFFA